MKKLEKKGLRFWFLQSNLLEDSLAQKQIKEVGLFSKCIINQQFLLPEGTTETKKLEGFKDN